MYLQYIEENYREWCHIYSDGSQIKTPDISTACGIYIPHLNLAHSWKLNPCHTVQYAELYAIIKSLKYSIDLPQRKIIILTDSKTSLQMIINPTRNYSSLISLIQKTLIHINKVKQLHLVWLRGHSGIRGNEIADKAAKQGHDLTTVTETPLTYSEIVCLLNSKSRTYWEKVWRESVHSSGVGKHLLSIRENIKPLPWTKFKDRRVEVTMNRLRMGHAGLNSYMYRFCLLYTSDAADE